MEVYKDKKRQKKNPMSEGGNRRQAKAKNTRVRGCGAARKGCNASGPMA